MLSTLEFDWLLLSLENNLAFALLSEKQRAKFLEYMSDIISLFKKFISETVRSARVSIVASLRVSTEEGMTFPASMAGHSML